MSPGHYLRPLFIPGSLALIGASERPDSLGRVVYENLLSGGFRGECHAVNPHHRTVLGRPSLPSLAAIGKPVDLAVICAPPAAISSILDQAQGRAKSAVVLSGAPSASARDYRRWERDMVARARASGVRLLGPASFGVIRTAAGLNASYGAIGAAAGRLTLISQSGAVCGALLDFARSAGIGFASVIGLGAAADVDVGEVLEFALADTETDGIVLYLETLHDARPFVSALRAAARTKPVIVLKAGRHPRQGAAGAIAPDAVFDAALKRAGTVRVHTYAQLFASARILASGRVPRGARLGIVTNGRGPGLLAADRAADLGVSVSLPPFSLPTTAALARLLPPKERPGNPLDVHGEAPPDRFAQAVATVLADGNVDAVLALHVPVPAAPPVTTALAVAAAVRDAGKPVLAAWLGVVEQPEARVALESAGIVNLLTPEIAIDAFSTVAAYRRNQAWLLEVPPPLPELSAPDLAAAERLRLRAQAAKRSKLTAPEAAALLQAFGVPVAPVAVATSVDGAVALARRIGYPVSLQAGDDRLALSRAGLRDGRMLRRAWRELVAARAGKSTKGWMLRKEPALASPRGARIAVRTDRVFGPVIAYGAADAPADEMALMLPPLNRRLAIDLIAGARLGGTPIDVQPLVALLLEVSALVSSLPWVVDLDLDPVLVNPVAAIVQAARAAVDPARARLTDGYRHMAIHPYPVELETTLVLPGGERLELRPIRPEDADLELAFFAGLSDESRYRRFMQHLSALTPQMLARFTQVDYDRELALIALAGGPSGRAIVGVARYVGNPDRESAEFAIAVADAWQGRGLGRALMRALIDCAASRGFKRIVGAVLASNAPMLSLTAALGFRAERDPHDAEQTIVTLALSRERRG